MRLFGAISQRGEAGRAESARQRNFEEDASTILEVAQRTSPDEAMKFHTMFDGFVHDSLAGFDLHSVEMSGHWRYRKGFHGYGTAQIVDINNAAGVARTG